MSKRYLLIKTISERPLTKEQFESALVSSIRRLFGEFGLGRIQVKVLRFNPTDSVALVACNKEGAEALQAAVGLIDGTPDLKIAAITTRVSGTIKGLRRKERF